MRTLIKICGLTRLEDARYCAAAGADYLGFVLSERSPRAVSPDQAKEIVGWLYGPQTVGVFVDADPGYVNEVARDVGFDLVQLHGSESPEECAQMEAPVIKAIGVGPNATGESLSQTLDSYRNVVQHVLLDTSMAGVNGGTGRPFDWEVVRDLVRRQQTFVAGGLNPENVQRMIGTLRPFALDVSSGVEESPGVKSFELVSALIDLVRGARN